MPSRSDIIRKIIALQERTVAQGCSEAEAMSAARLISKLLAANDLAMTDIELRNSSCEQGVISTFSHSAYEINFCIVSIGRFCDCKTWRHVDALSGIEYNFLGLPEDVRTAKWLYEIILTAMGRELVSFTMYCKETKTRATKKRTSSFLSGMAGRIGTRLVEMKRERDAETQQSTGRELVILKSDIVKRDFEALGINLHAVRDKGKSRDAASFRSGHKAGGRVNFNKTLGG